MSASPVSTRPYALTVENGTLNYSPQSAPDADATVTLTKATLDSVQLGQVSLEQAIAAGDVTIEGRKKALGEFLGLLDAFPFWFNIVTP